MPSSVPRSTRATEISGWHRRRQTSVCRRHRIDLFESSCIGRMQSCASHPDIVPMSGPPGILWPEASARGTHRTLLQRGHNNSRHALHSLHSLRVVPPGHLVLRTQQNMLAQSGKHGTHHPDTVSIGTISPPPEPVSDGKPDSSCVILSSRQDVAACEVAMPRKDSRQQEPHSEHPIEFKYGTGAQ